MSVMIPYTFMVNSLSNSARLRIWHVCIICIVLIQDFEYSSCAKGYAVQMSLCTHYLYPTFLFSSCFVFGLLKHGLIWKVFDSRLFHTKKRFWQRWLRFILTRLWCWSIKESTDFSSRFLASFVLSGRNVGLVCYKTDSACWRAGTSFYSNETENPRTMNWSPWDEKSMNAIFCCLCCGEDY